ncbi:copper-binding protein [Phenylobacterium montanum]|uniref:Copper-binding protein n=1 Tax=Phenylobacterium montanum TaxID=2823693 RepID=A0A975G4T2_9CAUL|nr:copper-binding protein [Caulobacter sp. S6]QUD90537.1 copper-binding protein [Caulobacter sp. S6]
MKLPFALLALLAAGPAFAQTMPDTPASSTQQPAAATAEGVGQIKSIDAKGGTLTIHHGPIAALGWPAMTMTFKASREALQTAKAGQTVKFTLNTPENEVVAVQAQ